MLNSTLLPHIVDIQEKKRARGFFFEGSLNYQNEIYRRNHQFDEEFVDAFGPGLGIGGKWGLSKNLLGSAHVRFYRDILNFDSNYFDGSIGISIGYRF